MTRKTTTTSHDMCVCMYCMWVRACLSVWHSIQDLMSDKQSMEMRPQRYTSKPSCSSYISREQGKNTWLCVREDGSHVSVIWTIAACSVYITYWMEEIQWFRKVKWQFNFDHNTSLISIWIHLWLCQIHFSFLKYEITRSGFQPVLCCWFPHTAWSGCTSIYHLIIQNEKWNWSPKHLYLNKRRGSQIMNVQNLISIAIPLFFY